MSDFPTNPPTGTTKQIGKIIWVWDGEKWTGIAANGPTGPIGFTGATGATGPQGAQGAQGATGFIGATGILGGPRYNFSSTYNSGEFTYNASPPSSVSTIIVNYNTVGSLDISGFLRSWDDSTSSVKGYLTVLSSSSNVSFINIFQITSATDIPASSIVVFSVTHVAGSTQPANSSEYVLLFSRTGDVGATGVAGAQGAQGLIGNTGATGIRGSTGAQGPAGPIGGSDTEIIYNNSGSADGVGTLTYNKSSGDLTLTGDMIIGAKGQGRIYSSTGDLFISGSLQGAEGIDSISFSNEDVTFQGNATSKEGYRITSSAITGPTGSYTLIDADNGKIIKIDSSSNTRVGIPTGLSIGFHCTVIQLGTGTLTVGATGFTPHPTIKWYGGTGDVNIIGQNGVATIIAYDTNTFNISGTLST